jgi:SAM-dependent methyltransferase
MTPGMEDARNYFSWIFEELSPHLTGRVLEVGSGFGVFSEAVAEKHPLVATDLDPRALEGLERRFSGRPDVLVRRLDVLDRGSCERLGSELAIDTVVSLNVLEHLAADGLALANMGRLVRPGGRVVVFVPAIEALYGSLDRLAGHHRRYDRALLAKRFADAGLRPRAIRYFNAIGALGWFVNGRVFPQTRLDSPSANGQARLYDRFVVGIARAIEHRIAPPFGQSVIGVGERP